MLVTPSLRHCSNKYKLAREGERWRYRKREGFFFMMKSSSVERDEFSVVAWRLTGIQRSGWGWEDHSTGQERWTRMFWRVILRRMFWRLLLIEKKIWPKSPGRGFRFFGAYFKTYGCLLGKSDKQIIFFIYVRRIMHWLALSGRN